MQNFYLKLNLCKLLRHRSNHLCYSSGSQKGPLEYKYGSKERAELETALKEISSKQRSVYTFSGPIRTPTGNFQFQRMPDNHKRSIATFFYAPKQLIEKAIKHGMSLQERWRKVCPTERVTIWRKCADLIENQYRHEINASLMLGQGKPYQQAEADTCALINSIRLNADNLLYLTQMKLNSKDPDKIFSSFHLRGLDGFISAITPFVSVALSANLALAPALMGNIVLWKPSDHCILSSYLVYSALLEAGLPKGIISFVPSNCRLFADTVTRSPHFGGVNYAGTEKGLRTVVQKISLFVEKYSCFPRISGDCGAKNFHFVHESADVDKVVESTVSAAFGYSGQLCAGCSRMYVPESLWPDLQVELDRQVCSLRVGAASDFRSFTSAVINEVAFDRIVSYLLTTKNNPNVEVISGGDYCKSLGYFIEPTILKCKNPTDRLMTEEIFGPILSVYVYKNDEFAKTLSIAANSTNFGFTGAIFARNNSILVQMLEALQMSAANMYINGPCTGPKMGLVQFSGNRLSGTNDKPGCAYALMRWASPQLVEETFDIKCS